MKRFHAEVLDALALDFALGMLCGRAARRYMSYVEFDDDAARAHDAWQLRAQRLTSAVAPRDPPDSLRKRMRRRLKSARPSCG